MLVALVVLWPSRAALAQNTTTGAVQGVVETAADQPVAGATVVATSPSLQGTQAEITDASGAYFLSNLPPGTYAITVYYGEASWARTNVLVQLGKTSQVNIAIDPGQAGGETILIEGNAPIIDQGSTKTGVTITEDYAKRIPTGRTFQQVLGAASSSQNDSFGTSFAGATSPENSYVIDGLNVTDPIYGGATATFQGASTTTNLPNEFIQEVEAITGGYDAEHGRATGSVINVATKSGGNEFSGTVFMYFSPGALTPDAYKIIEAGNAIAREDELIYDLSMGAELGGPIIEDRLWFHAGLNPVWTGFDVHRSINLLTPSDENGNPGPEDVQELSRTTYDRTRSTYMFTGKLSFAVTPENQGSLSVFGSPGSQDTFRRVSGREVANRLTVNDGALDVAAKWTSKLDDNKTQIDVVAGMHRSTFEEIPAKGGGNTSQWTVDEGMLGQFAMFEPGGTIPDACMDGTAADPYPDLINCPVINYNLGGLGLYEALTGDRLAGSIKVTRRMRAAGHHQLKAGLDIEHNSFDRHTAYTGGQRYIYSPERYGDVLVRGFYELDDSGQGLQPLPGGVDIDTASRNLSWFAQDSWSVLPNLTFSAGIRWERQTLYTADELAGKPSLETGNIIDDEAFTLHHLWSPRLSAIYDWTREGRAKLFGHWGRYYQTIPLHINSEAFGGEISGDNFYYLEDCTSLDTPGMGAACDPGAEPYYQEINGGQEQLVVPDIEGQYLDQVILGVEYELLADVKVGASYIRRDLGRVIEDMAIDTGAPTVIGNPGEAVDQAEIDAIRAEAAAARMSGNEALAAFLDSKARSFAAVGSFDAPERVYQALQLTASKRFARNLMIQAAYTYSSTRGNIAGLIQSENGINGLTPNLGSLYDLPDLMINQYGKLPQDRPHLLKIDGYYFRELGDMSHVVLGTSIRASSGVPYSARGSHPTEGSGDTLILPRGAVDRTAMVTQLDAKLTYGRRLSKAMTLEAFVDIFNVLSRQSEVAADEIYTYDDVLPIVGGDIEDLAHLKRLDRDGQTLNQAAAPNPNFGNVIVRQTPREFRFGLRLSF